MIAFSGNITVDGIPVAHLVDPPSPVAGTARIVWIRRKTPGQLRQIHAAASTEIFVGQDLRSPPLN